MPLAVMVEHLANYGVEDTAVYKMSEVVARGTTLKCSGINEVEAHGRFRGVKGRPDVVKGCGVADGFSAEGRRGKITHQDFGIGMCLADPGERWSRVNDQAERE